MIAGTRIVDADDVVRPSAAIREHVAARAERVAEREHIGQFRFEDGEVGVLVAANDVALAVDSEQRAEVAPVVDSVRVEHAAHAGYETPQRAAPVRVDHRRQREYADGQRQRRSDGDLDGAAERHRGE